MFGIFGLQPALGRLLTGNDDLKVGGHPVAVISYDYWKTRFGSNPQTVGKTFRIGDELYEVSSPGESHPEALAEPCLNVSAHTAPIMEPRRTPICQCAHNLGSRLEIRATQ